MTLLPDIILAVGCDQKRLTALARDVMQPDRILITSSSMSTVQTVLDYSAIRLIMFDFAGSNPGSLTLLSSMLRVRKATRIPWLIVTEGDLPVLELEQCSVLTKCDVIPLPESSSCLNDKLTWLLSKGNASTRTREGWRTSSLPSTGRLHESSAFPSA